MFHNQNNFATLICSPKPTIPPIVLRRILSLSISHITQHHSLYANKSDSSSCASCNLCARKPRNLRYFRLTCTNEIQIFDNVQRAHAVFIIVVGDTICARTAAQKCKPFGISLNLHLTPSIRYE